jgi:hypothetical protein
MAEVAAINDRLEQIGREITVRIGKIDKLAAKGGDHVDTIDHLLAEAEKLCGTPESFEQFKRQHCPKLSKSRAYELLAIRDGRKSPEDTRAATRARVAKHRAAKRGVTEADSVTSDVPTKIAVATPINEPEAPNASAEARKAQYAAADDSAETKQPRLSKERQQKLQGLDDAARESIEDEDELDVPNNPKRYNFELDWRLEQAYDKGR